MATDLEIAWLAGLLEGEGCFLIQHHASPSIQLCMNDYDVVAKAARIMEMSLDRIHLKKTNQPNHKPGYVLRCDGPEAFVWMRAIRPHMGDRRGAKIDYIIFTVKAARPHIDKGRDVCRKGHSIKYEWEYYVGSSGQRQCKRCLGVNPKPSVRFVPIDKDFEKNNPNHNPFKKKISNG
jgi:hypothetical protein